MSTTVYLRPSPQRDKKKHKHESPTRDLRRFFFRYRDQLYPLGVMIWVYLLACLLSVPVLALLGAVCTTGVLAQGARLGLYRPIERRYAAVCCAAGTVWAVASTVDGYPSPRAVLILCLLTGVCATPWWRHRRARGTVPVRFDYEVDRREREAMVREARALVDGWTSFASAARMQGAKLQAITYNRWSVALAVVLRRGSIVEEFTTRRLRTLESAFGGVKPGSARVEQVDTSARLAILRFMTSDPHAEPIKPPETGQTDFEKIAIGLFETGEDILFNLVNTLIAGMTGSGKSGVVNVIIRALAKIPHVAIIGIDMKPGAPELSKWEPVMHALADDPAKTAAMLDQLLLGLEYRGRVMNQNGWRVWKPSRENPFIVLIVDEVQRLKAAGLGKKLDRVTEIIRAYGGCVVVATQYPVKENLSKTVKENCPQRIGLRTEDASADRVIFGERATREQWHCSSIPLGRKGSLLIRNEEYAKPLLGRAYWLDDDDVARDAEELGRNRTPIDAATWGQLEIRRNQAEITAAEMGAYPEHRADQVAREVEDGEIVDAVVMDDDPTERVFLAVCNGIHRAIDIGHSLGLSRAQTYRYLKALADEGRIQNLRGQWKLPKIDG